MSKLQNPAEMRMHFCRVYFLLESNPYSFNLANADVIAAPVVKAGGFSIGVARHALRHFDPSAIA